MVEIKNFPFAAARWYIVSIHAASDFLFSPNLQVISPLCIVTISEVITEVVIGICSSKRVCQSEIYPPIWAQASECRL